MTASNFRTVLKPRFGTQKELLGLPRMDRISLPREPWAQEADDGTPPASAHGRNAKPASGQKSGV